MSGTLTVVLNDDGTDIVTITSSYGSVEIVADEHGLMLSPDMAQSMEEAIELARKHAERHNY